MLTAKEIASKLKQRAEEVVRYLFPNGVKQGNEFHVGNITGEKGHSLKICLRGEKIGIWCDFADSSTNGGDLLDLWAAKRSITLSEAMKEAAHYLGLSMPHFDAYKPLNFHKPQIKEMLELNTSSLVLNYLMNERKLTAETIGVFKISESNGKIIFPYWREGELISVKYLSLNRENGKKQIVVEANCEPCLFGWHLIPSHSRTLTICEGEIDAMTLHQYGFPTLSVPFGAGTGDKHKWLEFEFDRLAQFDTIYLCFDNDPEGHAASTELLERLGRHRTRIVQLPYNDANACLQAGVTKESMQCCFQSAQTCDPAELKRASVFVDEVIDLFYPAESSPVGYAAPWEKANGLIRFRPEELSVWTGINGHGKSQLLGNLILHLMNNGARVCIASLELKPKRLLARLTRQAGGLSNPTEQYIRAIHDWYSDRLWLFDLVGTAKSKRLLEVFLYARQRYGIDVFVIDSFMKLDIAEDDYKAQKSFMEQLCDFKNQHNCHIHIVVHPRKGADEKMPPGKLDNKGTGAISDLADNCFTVWRNKGKEELERLKSNGKLLTPAQSAELESVDCLWNCDKQRNGEWEGRLGLWFDRQSFQYLNHQNQRPIQFVPYSNVTP